MASAAAVLSGARPWNQEFSHADRERWVCIYPLYINSKKTLAEGRRVPLTKGVDNPLYSEIRDVCAAAGLTLGVENKVHPREMDSRDTKSRGRIRVQLKNEDGSPVNDKFPTRQSILLYLGETIPKLKGRQQQASSAAQAGQQSGGAASASSGGGKKKKGKRN
ncbi:hypothetical protein CAPTEDRAFT_172694 [Capitella teleta]|uniref:Signal recognition particle 19 kDa protein n=1 Tax=Capitella teleta TaxID=283909 RepID=R7V1R5_CAPTE|nr:hypothetical protein CAPTEDRAFT_172694 [Capitella teleta]|eukprot:ELU12447.1 hypothetical protein CAPTEDRAFT_172694 [Capitella teleta]